MKARIDEQYIIARQGRGTALRNCRLQHITPRKLVYRHPASASTSVDFSAVPEVFARHRIKDPCSAPVSARDNSVLENRQHKLTMKAFKQHAIILDDDTARKSCQDEDAVRVAWHRLLNGNKWCAPDRRSWGTGARVCRASG